MRRQLCLEEWVVICGRLFNLHINPTAALCGYNLREERGSYQSSGLKEKSSLVDRKHFLLYVRSLRRRAGWSGNSPELGGGEAEISASPPHQNSFCFCSESLTCSVLSALRDFNLQRVCTKEIPFHRVTPLHIPAFFLSHTSGSSLTVAW